MNIQYMQLIGHAQINNFMIRFMGTVSFNGFSCPSKLAFSNTVRWLY